MKKLKILLFPHYSDQSIPMRTPTSEVFGRYLSKKHKIKSLMKKTPIKHFYWENIEFYNTGLFKFVKKAIQLSKKEKFDVVFIRDDLFLILIGFVIKKLYKVSLVVHYTIPIRFFTDFEYNWYHPKNLGGLIKHYMTLRLMRKVDLILACSSSMGKYLKSTGIKSRYIHNFPNGANPNLFKFYNYPITKSSPVYIYIGTLAKIRSIDILIRAFNIVYEKYKNAHLLIVGTGNGYEDLLTLAKSFEIEKNITFTGQIPYDEVPKYIAKSHIALCPVAPLYHLKLFSPLKLFEYMSCGRAVIANKDIPEHKKPILEGRAGALVDFTPASFAEAMIKLFEQPEKAKEMGKNARKWIEENRTYEKIALDLEKKLFDIISS